MIPRLSKKPLKRSAIKRSTKPIRKVNPKAKAKRKIAYRKMLAGKEYKAARAEAMARAGNRCELWWSWTTYHDPYPGLPFTHTAASAALTTNAQRCEAVEGLHAHHKSYPKSRKLLASDLTICCKPHHEYLESQKMGKTRMY